jgi:hypothetical protein
MKRLKNIHPAFEVKNLQTCKQLYGLKKLHPFNTNFQTLAVAGTIYTCPNYGASAQI